MPVRQEFLDRKARQAHATSWAKGDNWKHTRGGFNPDVFKDLDDATRQRVKDYQIGPANLRGDKGLGIGGLFSMGHWGDGRHGTENFNSDLLAGHYKNDNYDANARRFTNRGDVQQAAWEAGFPTIGDKQQLNQLLARADSVKAKHGDFLKDGWTPEAIMLMRGQPQQEQAPAPQEAAPAAPTQPSQELLAARSRWDGSLGRGSVPFNPTGDGILDAATYGNLATNDFANRFKQQLNAQTNLEGHEIGDAGNYHMNRFEGEPTELASSDIKDLYKYYSKQISDIS